MNTIEFKDCWKVNKQTIINNWNKNEWFRHQKYEDDVRKYINAQIEYFYEITNRNYVIGFNEIQEELVRYELSEKLM